MTPCPTFGNAMLAACHHEQPNPYPFTILRLLLEHGGDPNLVLENGSTLLQVMASSSTAESLQTINALIKTGADCNIHNDTHGTAIAAAAASGGTRSIDVLELLHNAGAEVDSSVMVAAAGPQSFKSEEKLWKLIEWGADASQPGPLQLFADVAARHPDPGVRSLVLDGHNANQTKLGNVALMEAAAVGTVETMLDLIEKGADVNAQVEFLGSESTPLVAAICTSTEDCLQKIQLLVLHGADIHVSALGYSNVLQLHLDCKDPSPGIVMYLLNSGLDANTPSGPAGKGTAMEIALRRGLLNLYVGHGWRSVIVLLQRAAADISDEDFETLLQFPWFMEGLTANPEQFLITPDSQMEIIPPNSHKVSFLHVSNSTV